MHLLLSFEVGPFNVHFSQTGKPRSREDCPAGEQIRDRSSGVPPHHPDIRSPRPPPPPPPPLCGTQGTDAPVRTPLSWERAGPQVETSPEAAPRPAYPVPGT